MPKVLTLKFLSGWNPWFFLALATLLSVSAWILYRRELRWLGLGREQWIIPLLRSTAIFLIVLTLAEPAVERRHRQGQPGQIHFLIDGSNSMTLTDESKDLKGNATANRFDRAVAALTTQSSGVIEQISDQFDIHIWRADDIGNTLLWKSNPQTGNGSLPYSERWMPTQWSSRSALGDRLSQLREQSSANNVDGSNRSPQSIFVLMSDGQSNAGVSTQIAADELAQLGVSVTTVGYGPETQTQDLVIKSFEAPQRIFKTDQLAGRIILADTLPKGSPYQVQILHDGVVVWQRSLQAHAELQREIPFEVPVEELYLRATSELPSNVRYNNLPLKLVAKLVTATREQSTDNNQMDFYLNVGSSKSQILMIEGRSRWEARYVKNLFARDPVWQLTPIFTDAATEQESKDKLPQSQTQWQEYHLVILGDVPSSAFQSTMQQDLVDFVNRGGGLIISDGARKHLHSSEFTALAPLLPIRLQDNTASSLSGNWNAELTLAGRQIAALNLDPKELAAISDEPNFDSDNNANFWKQLPALEFVQAVSSGIGSETLVEATSNGATIPLIVGRRFGAGQVLYLASDETWRWRYKVADQVHQRLWNQLARWIMRKPMSLESEFLSLDTGSASYVVGRSVEIRTALRQQDGGPAVNRRTVAVVSRDGNEVERVNLQADETNPGYYVGMASDLPAGEYQISIESEGFTKEALSLQSSFAVVEPSLSAELLSTSCDASTLQQVSQTTGGSHFHESQIALLSEHLRPLSGGKIVHSTQLLWQSYYWFFAALLLLAIEWVLRKRAGLI